MSLKLHKSFLVNQLNLTVKFMYLLKLYLHRIARYLFLSTYNSGVSIKLVRSMRILMLAVGVNFIASHVYAAIEVYEFETEQQEQQYRQLIDEFRCPKCQNQNLAGSDSQIAQDLKRKTYDLVKSGQSNQQIKAYMNERYGDFISYKPPLRPSTYILWLFPPIFLILLLVWWVWRNSRLNIANSKANLATNLESDKTYDDSASDLNNLSDVDGLKTGLTAKESVELDELLDKFEANSKPNDIVKEP